MRDKAHPINYGIAVSPGVAVARAFCIDPALGQSEIQSLSPTEVTLELSRFDQACEEAANELRALIEKVCFEIGERESAIFQAHLVMLRDKALIGKVKTLIVESQTDASTCLHEAAREYEELFNRIEDEYLRERLVDLRDVVARIQSHLSSHRIQEALPAIEGPVIIVAEEIFPSQAVAFKQLDIAGIVTERGGETGHSAIIARSMGIPAVSGINELRTLVHTGDLLAIDGRDGCIIVNPGPQAEAAYRKLQREFFDLKDSLVENRDLPSITIDGEQIDLLANINNITDARAAVDVGAAGIGLFRTEYIFLTHPSIPDEEEQYRVYRDVLKASPNKRLTIRTLDLGGDKTVPYLGTHRETNPFMGWRSIRQSFEHPEFFRKQIRAILRASPEGNVQMMFPMVSTVEELRRANRMVWQVKQQLEREGTPQKRIPVGIMVEVPAAAICIDHLLPHADFISIGTNDLIQYLMAADRDNPKVSHLCDPLNPAAIRMIEGTIQACDAANKPVTVCGEFAGRPRGILLLLAFGLRKFSVSPALLPTAKELIHSITLSDLKAIACDIRKKRSATLTRKFLHQVLHDINPKLAVLESKRTPQR